LYILPEKKDKYTARFGENILTLKFDKNSKAVYHGSL